MNNTTPARKKSQAATGNFVQELARRMLAFTKKTGIGLGQGQQSRLHRFEILSHTAEQSVVLHEVIQHQTHHLFP